MRHLVRLVLAGLLGACAAVLVACGGGSNAGYLSSDQASALNNRLTSISGALSSHNCPTAIAQTAKLARDVANLPPTVSPILRANLIQGASTIARLTPHDCAAPKTTPTTTQTTTTAVTQTQTAPSTTTSTPPATTQAQPPPTTPTQTQTPPPKTTPGTGGAGIGNSGNTGNTGQSSGGAGANTGNTGNHG